MISSEEEDRANPKRAVDLVADTSPSQSRNKRKLLDEDEVDVALNLVKVDSDEDQ